MLAERETRAGQTGGGMMAKLGGHRNQDTELPNPPRHQPTSSWQGSGSKHSAGGCGARMHGAARCSGGLP